MQNRLPLIHQIQADAVDSSTPVVQVVRTAKIAASKLGLTEAVGWIDKELNGYPSSNPELLPTYRVLQGECQGWNAFRGWLPVIISDNEIHNLLCKVGVAQPLASIEDLVRDNGRASPVMPYGPEQQQLLCNLTSQNTKFQLKLSRSHIANILDGVRTMALDWSLTLEAAGIIGENMSFKPNERNAAQSATQNYFIQNAGVVGNVSGEAAISISQTATIDIAQARQLLEQISPLIAHLPSSLKDELGPVINESTACVEQANPDHGRLRELLISARSICEGAAGNILATGIAGSLANLLS